MPEVVGDIIKSKAVIWIAPKGEARPDETTVAAGASWGGNWVKVGYTKEAVAAKYEFDTHQVFVDQILGPVKEFKRGESFMAETVLSEGTALNLAYASGGDGNDVTTTAAGASQVGFEEMDVGDDPLMEEWELGIEGIKYDDADGALPIRLFSMGIIKINGDLSFSKRDDDHTGIPFQFKALADTGNSNRMFTWQRVTAAATS